MDFLFTFKRIMRVLGTQLTGRTAFSILLLIASAAVGGVRLVNANPGMDFSDNCHPSHGNRWTTGSPQPLLASQVEQMLSQNGIRADVEAREYGETDSCGTFSLFSIDFSISIINSPSGIEINEQNLKNEIYPLLVGLAKPRLGNVNIFLPDGKKISLNDKMLAEDIKELASTTNWQQITTNNAPPPRYLYGLAYDSYRQVTVLFGGDDTGYSRLNDTWEYDGANWHQIFAVQSPPGRANIDQTLVFDTNRNKTILFGGLGQYRCLSDTWEYDGMTWTEIDTPVSPVARDAHAMAYDSDRDKTVLFGGYQSSSTYLNDTWEYDGTWRQVSTLQSPASRIHHSMAYDANRHVTVLFGGVNIDGQYLGDTWEYDGAGWSRITPLESPSARDNHSIAYDSSRGVIVLFGGNNENGPLNDTWEYDGTTWKQIDLNRAPSNRNEMSLAYDTQRSKIVLFGGGYWTSEGTLIVFGDTWEYSEEIFPVQIDKKVYIIILDPLLSPGETLIEYMNWNDPDVLTQGMIDFFYQNSGGQVNYSVVDVYEDNSGWPSLIDGYTYTKDEYLAVLSGQNAPHYPQEVDYNAIVNDPDYDICGKANRGEIDEVWIYNGPYFGFYESTLVGPGAYWYNSDPVRPPYECNVLVPIMGPNPERGLECAIENFGHRTESTMTRVYGSWQENSISHSWDKFALVDALSQSFDYSGCGSIHYPPNGTQDYDYANLSTAFTNCNDFDNYPNLSDPMGVLHEVNCSAWGCSHLGYFEYWFDHLPSNAGCGPDDIANNWWLYFASPALANNPSSACKTNLTVNYTTGSPGSYFTIAGSLFPPDSALMVEVNDVLISSALTTDSNGDLSFIIDTSYAGIGSFQVTVTVYPSVTLTDMNNSTSAVSFELASAYPYRPLTGDGPFLIVKGDGSNPRSLPLKPKHFP